NPFDLDNGEAEGSDDNMDAHLDTHSDASSDEDEDEDENDLAEGCVVQMVIDTAEDTQGRPGTSRAQGSTTDTGWEEPTIHYPNPEIITAKTRNNLVTVKYLVRAHFATNLINDISVYLRRLHPKLPPVVLSPDTRLHIWTVARLFHAPLPFKPLKPQQVDHIRACPPRVDIVDCVLRVGQYDTVLVLAYPNKIGIHRYRAARVRVIFELPPRYKDLCPQPL
ncbi:hypothetical protein FRC11_003272, partial [Ceratobasidium sp. 423]